MEIGDVPFSEFSKALSSSASATPGALSASAAGESMGGASVPGHAAMAGDDGGGMAGSVRRAALDVFAVGAPPPPKGKLHFQTAEAKQAPSQSQAAAGSRGWRWRAIARARRDGGIWVAPCGQSRITGTYWTWDRMLAPSLGGRGPRRRARCSTRPQGASSQHTCSCTTTTQSHPSPQKPPRPRPPCAHAVLAGRTSARAAAAQRACASAGTAPPTHLGEKTSRPPRPPVPVRSRGRRAALCVTSRRLG
ncbi:hypothetical protein B484DRAFT_189123 [Ochromonadaceae sp. CCMP2298]|nr:hypothetical protein B484DRAFT_189123 [Ochromonadaceae sp. CCMP2298]